jgi:hypothetical protein
MSDLVPFLSSVLAAMGLTILLVWPTGGPSAWFRDRVLKRMLPSSATGVLDCYICFGFWSGLLGSVPVWLVYRQPWSWTLCLVVPFLFWLVVTEKT